MGFAAGLCVGLSSMAAGIAIGIIGDVGVRCNAQQPKLFVGLILILIFAEALGLYGLMLGSWWHQELANTRKNCARLGSRRNNRSTLRCTARERPELLVFVVSPLTNFVCSRFSRRAIMHNNFTASS